MTDHKSANIDMDEEMAPESVGRSGSYFTNLEKFRITPDYAAGLGVKRLLTHVPIRRPNRQWWVRVHPSEEYRLPAGLIEVEGEDTYIVDHSLHLDLEGDLVFKTLYLTVNRQGDPFIWPVRLPSEDGRLDDWNRVAKEGAELAMGQWVRVSANRSMGTYDLFQAEAQLPDPKWPTETFKQILEVAFKNRIIEDTDHPVIRQLHGLV